MKFAMNQLMWVRLVRLIRNQIPINVIGGDSSHVGICHTLHQ